MATALASENAVSPQLSTLDFRHRCVAFLLWLVTAAVLDERSLPIIIDQAPPFVAASCGSEA
jgi:hypothetical protein